MECASLGDIPAVAEGDLVPMASWCQNEAWVPCKTSVLKEERDAQQVIMPIFLLENADALEKERVGGRLVTTLQEREAHRGRGCVTECLLVHFLVFLCMHFIRYAARGVS